MPAHNILVLAPHTDDAELGCGGMIARKVEEGANVCVAALSSAEQSLPEGAPPGTLKQEFYEAMAILGVPRQNLFVYDYAVRRLSYDRQDILDNLIWLKREFRPDTVFLPSSHDVHQDHHVVHTEGIRAFKDISVLGYELPWNHITFTAQAFLELKREHIERKWEALQAYRSQFDLKRPYFTTDFVYGLAAVRGTQIKTEWAEAYEVLRVRL